MTREHDRENESDMTTYPLEFHRRSERKWVRRAQAASARESIWRTALVGTCPSQKSYPCVAVMQSEQNWSGNNGT
jgi:hypothetical protein